MKMLCMDLSVYISETDGCGTLSWFYCSGVDTVRFIYIYTADTQVSSFSL